MEENRNWYDGAPALVDADGEPIRIGDVLYSKGNECRVVSITVKADEAYVGVRTDEGVFLPSVNPRYLSRKNPGPLEPEPADSWERLEQDAAKTPCDYFGVDCPNGCDGCPAESDATDPHICYEAMARDLIRRAKALAESDTNGVDRVPLMPSYCPECGARVVSGDGD